MMRSDELRMLMMMDGRHSLLSGIFIWVMINAEGFVYRNKVMVRIVVGTTLFLKVLSIYGLL